MANPWIALVIDDAAQNADLMERALEHVGIAVYTARNGLEGWALLQQLMPTFILLDLRMPEMDGWAFLDRLRQDARYRHLPVIVVSAHLPASDPKQRVLDLDAFIQKPFRLESFISTIRDCVSRRSALQGT